MANSDNMHVFETKLNQPKKAAEENPKKSERQKSENLENLEPDLENYLKEEILNHATKINEGNAGVIGLIDLKEVPAPLASILQQADKPKIKTDSRFATKILKVYQFGAGRQEFAIQKRAYELINQKDSDKFVRIPKIYLYRQLNLKDDDGPLKNKLETEGIDVSSQKCELMLMDFVPGDDFGTYLYKEVVKNATDHELFNDAELLAFREEIRTGKISPDFAQLDEIVEILVGLKYSDENADLREQIKTEQENYLRIVNFLQQKKFRLDGEKFNKIRTTLNYLHKNGIYHRDLHERNIMLTYEPGSDRIADFYLVDFGEAIDTQTQSHEAYRDRDYIYRDDNFILNVCETLTKEPDELKREKVFKLLNNLNRAAQHFKSQPAAQEPWKQTLLSDNLEKLSDNLEKTIQHLTSSLDGAWEIRYALIAELGQNNLPLAKEYIKSILPKSPLAVKNQWHQIDKLF